MGYTKYGEFIRVLRVKHHEVMGDTAKLLNCMVSFVSSVESGKKNVVKTWARASMISPDFVGLSKKNYMMPLKIRKPKSN